MDNIFSENIPWAIGLVVVLFGIIAAHRLVSYRDKKNTFNNAAKEFSDTFHRELKDIFPHPFNWPPGANGIDIFLRAKFPVLQSAIAKFRHSLPWYKRLFFNRAWFHYRCSTGREIDTQCYHHYMSFDNNPNYKENFKHNVDNLLKYAKQK